MADDVTVDNGTGTDYTVATDDDGSGGQVQIVKLAQSANGSRTPITADTDGILVNLGANNDVTVTGTVTAQDGGSSLTVDDGGSTISIDDGGGAVTVDGTVAATQSGTWNVGTVTTITNVVHVDDNSSTLSVDDGGGSLTVDDGGGSLTVDGTVGVSGTVTVDSELTTADLDTGAGTDTRAVVGLIGSKSGGGALIPGDATAGLKVDLGADNDVTVTSGTITTITNVVHVDDNSSTLSVDDGGSSLTVDGTVTANLAAGTNNIGDVDVLSVPAPLSTTGGGTEATALRVTVATDSTGVLSVDDNGGSLTVDGTVAATQSGTWNVGTVSTITNVVHVDDNSGTLSIDDGGGSVTVDGSVSVSGTVTAAPLRGATATLSQVADSATSVTLIAANSNRITVAITNDSSARLYVRYGATAASTTAYTFSLAQHDTSVITDYNGEIRGIWATDPDDGAARVTEVTA